MLVPAARSITITGSALDAVSLLPQDLASGADTVAVRGRLATAIGITWTNELVTVTGTDPAGPRCPAPVHCGRLARRLPHRGPARAVAGTQGVGEATMVRAVARDAGAQVVEVAAPRVTAVQPDAATQRVHDAVAAASRRQPSVLLITDVEALLPATAPLP